MSSNYSSFTTFDVEITNFAGSTIRGNFLGSTTYFQPWGRGKVGIFSMLVMPAETINLELSI